ncbi:MAG: gamma carbonic anhydrase family protein [Burkholderiaceae bacterium]|jgi:carbonic anhydrase/acetyltransferase-like protein (isoleucine patch superfamily)
MAIYALDVRTPIIAATAYVAELASIIGRVEIGEYVSIWDHAALRGDNEPIRIGQGSNVQESAVLHTDLGTPLTVGEFVTIGHQAMLHGCTVENGALIGIQAVVLNRAVIGAESLVGAGALVTEGKVFPPRSLILGSPARVVRALTAEELQKLRMSSEAYIDKAYLFKTQLMRIG